MGSRGVVIPSVFFLFFALDANCSVEWNRFFNFDTGSLVEHICEIILKSNHQLARNGHSIVFYRPQLSTPRRVMCVLLLDFRMRPA